MNLKGEHEQILEWLQTAVLNEERPITEMFAIENQRIGGRPRADRAARHSFARGAADLPEAARAG